VSYARRRHKPRPGPTGAGPGDFYRHRQRRRERASLAATADGPTVGQVAHPESLIAAYDALAAHGGKAPGPDGLTYADLGRGEACAVLRELSPVSLVGAYAPSAGRRLAIPKPGGGTRTLTIVNILDRVVAAALARALTPLFEAVFLPCSYGFRPTLGTQNLLADLMAAMAALQITTLAIDDVEKAFDNVAIAPLMEIFAEHITDESLLQLTEIVLRGGEDRDRTVGIPQGNPLSPLALNTYLHRVHDLPLEGDRDFPPLYRFADNVVYLCEGVPEGHQALDRVRHLLAHAGLALKGADGDPVDLREGGEARLLGFRLSLHEDRLRLGLREDALESDLAMCLTKAHDDPDPHRMARTALRGWVASHGPALGDLTEDDTEAILHTAARHGFRELASREELTDWCTAAHGRWGVRYTAALTRLGLTDEDCLFVAAPPATVRPGV
jgi:RNA-directed DNA polymerase